MKNSLSDAQRLALNSTYQPFRVRAEWPQYAYVDKALDRSGFEIETVVQSLPPGLMIPDPARHSFFPQPHDFFPQPHDELKLTIAGIAACHDSEPDIDVFMRALRLFVELEEDYEPPPSGGEPLRAGSAELVAALGMTNEQVRRAYHLVRNEIGVVGSGGGGPDD